MSKKKIDGFTITLKPEYKDSNGYIRCAGCKTITALVSPCGQWIMDEEAFKSGETIPDSDIREVHVGEISGHWCSQCEILTSLSYNFG